MHELIEQLKPATGHGEAVSEEGNTLDAGIYQVGCEIVFRNL